MSFDINHYNQEKSNIIELIKNNHKWEDTEGFIADGVINPVLYKKEKLKVLVILSETYGYDSCGVVDIENQSTKDIMGLGSAQVQSPRKLSTLFWLLFNSIEKKKKISYEDFIGLSLLKINDYNYSELQKVLMKVAWINVKKASKCVEDVNCKQDYNDIYRNAFRNKEVLKKQLSLISPDLIIVCGAPVFDSLNEMELLGEDIRKEKLCMQKNDSGQHVIYLSHPSAYKYWGYESIYKKFEIIYDSMVDLS
jgi:hypothetical protein